MIFGRYQTEIGEAQATPLLAGTTLLGQEFQLEPASVLIMGWNFHHIASWEIWWKLLFAEFPQSRRFHMGFITGNFERRHLAVLDQCVPQSRHTRTCLWRDPEQEWMKWAFWQDKHEVLTTLVRGDGSALYMKGLPTEEAWELFSREFNREIILWNSRLAAPRPGA